MLDKLLLFRCSGGWSDRLRTSMLCDCLPAESMLAVLQELGYIQQTHVTDVLSHHSGFRSL